MKPIKDLAEHLAKDNRVNQRALERFNYNLEAIRCTVALHRDYLTKLTNNAGSNPHLASLVINLEMFIRNLDESAIVPTQSPPTQSPPSHWTKETAEKGFTEHFERTVRGEFIDDPSDRPEPNTWDKASSFPLTGNDRADAFRYAMAASPSPDLKMPEERRYHALDASKYLGSDGSGDCDSFKDPEFCPKKWVRDNL